MLTTDVNQLNMALAVQKVINECKEIWSGHKGFTEEVNAMTKQLELIKQHQQQAEVKTIGVTKDKANAARYAIEMAMNLAGSAYVYAKKAKDEKLKEQFKILKKSLTNVEELVALSRLNDLYDNLEAVVEKMGDYVTKKELAKFKEAIYEFGIRISDPRKVIVTREMSNEILAEGVKELKSIFENMDNLISKFKDSEFEKEYKLARIVIDHGSRKGGKGDKDEPKDDEPKE